MPKTILDVQKKLNIAIALGMFLYLSKFFRTPFADHKILLFYLGFLPNFGLSFAIPFIYVANRINLKKYPKHFNISCFVTFLLMVLNEIRDKYQPKRVFDLLDIYASLVGVIFAFILYHLLLKKQLCQES